MAEPLSFQQVILRLQRFWADQSCLIWQPYSEKLGAGTMNPATVLRVLGPEPWNVAYVEPSYRPDDGRYGDNPNRMQMHTQFQVILKPDPGNPQEIYLQSLAALGIRREEHDIRFVEDNWESPVLGAWGLGWEVWLDGLEITQFTYFQQSGGLALEPPSVEITYGLERIVIFLQRVRSVWDINWNGLHTYGDVLLQAEVEHCRYDFELADVEAQQQLYALYEAEAERCLDAGLVVPAHDYVLRCSHAFNLLDSRGAVGVTERATFFKRMRELSRRVAENYLEQRQRLEYPWLDVDGETVDGTVTLSEAAVPATVDGMDEPGAFLLEIGTEELPAGDLSAALEQLRERAPAMLKEERLEYDQLRVLGTPRRLALLVHGLAPRQRAVEELVKGPPVRAAYDDKGRPTKAAQGFARKYGVSVKELETREMDGGEYIVAVSQQEGRPTGEVLSERLPELVASLRFQRPMRWNATGVSFSRPIRWLAALLGGEVVPFEYAGLVNGRASRGSRPEGSPEFDIASAGEYLALMKSHRIVVDPDERRELIASQAAELAASVGGQLLDDPTLLEEVTHLVEQPTALLGEFEAEYLDLPDEVLVAVMKKHQRYFPIYRTDADAESPLLPYFVAVRNGGEEHMDVVRTGNEEVIRARFADGKYFYEQDTQQPLEAFLPRLDTLTFEEHLGSMLAKTQRLEKLVPELAQMVALSEAETQTAVRAAHLSKADLATSMVVEFTSLQGAMGREYAFVSEEPDRVAQAIYEHYLPRSTGDELPQSRAGMVVGLADRLDSLAGLFGVDLAPTGSADPYGLRRAALGLIYNLIAIQLPFSVRAGLEAAAQLLPVEVGEGALQAAEEFVTGRLRVHLRELGFGHDVVEAVLAERGDNPYRALQSVEQLSDWVARDDWPRILDNYARCVRITRDLEIDYPLDPALFEEKAEKTLHKAYQKARKQVTSQSSVDEFLETFLPLVDVIDGYFAKESGVLVMTDDQAVRENRLAQLQQIAALAEGIADLSRLEGF